MSTTIVEAKSSLTERYQTTVPEVVRRFLGLSKRDQIKYELTPQGQVVLSRVTEEGVDPVLGPFLRLLAGDMAQHPERLQSLNAAAVERSKALVTGVSFDMDEALPEEDE